jgi:hypothetical protein
MDQQMVIGVESAGVAVNTLVMATLMEMPRPQTVQTDATCIMISVMTNVLMSYPMTLKG